MTKSHDLPIEHWDATTMNQAIRTKEISVSEMVEDRIERISRFEDLNALVHCASRESLAQESELIQARVNLNDDSALLGVPITVKDVIAVAGMPLTAGSRILKGNKSKIDAQVVRRLREAGVLILGKTNCPEFAFGIGTTNDLFGSTINPLGQHLSPGGSSGGEAVSVATGMSLLGVGTDFGGSIRWPAQCTGVLGLRPTPGRLSSMGQLVGMDKEGLDGLAQLDVNSLQGSLQVPGFIARSVADLQRALSVCEEDTLPNDHLNGYEFELSSVAIGWSEGANIGPIGTDVRAMMGDLARVLSQDGLNTKYVGDAFQGAREAFDELRSYDEMSAIRSLAHERLDELSRNTRELLRTQPRSREKFERVKAEAAKRRSMGLEQLNSTPLFLLPVAGCAATSHDEVGDIDGKKVTGFALMAHCRAISLIGVPVVSIPVTTTTTGLPLSVQVIAPPFSEHLAFALARRIEVLTGGWQPIKNL